MFNATSSMGVSIGGNRDISSVVGGGIFANSLMLIEGESKSGKSIFSQHLAHGALNSKENSVAYYITEKAFDDLIAQMDSLSLDVTHDIATDRLRIHPMSSPLNTEESKELIELLVNHISNLPSRFKLILVDSTTPLMLHLNSESKVDLLIACKQLCTRGRSVVLVTDTHALEKGLVPRAYSISDYYIKLRSKDAMLESRQIDDRAIKIMEVLKIHGAELRVQEGTAFEIRPNSGISVLPYVNVKI